MYYFVFIDSDDSDQLKSIINVYYRGVDRGAQTVTLVQAALILPMAIIALLYLPSLIYVSILHIKKSNKEIKVIERVLMFVFTMFTNLCYINSSKTQFIIEPTTLGRPKSAPALTNADVELLTLKPKSKSLSTMAINYKVLDQPNFSLYHSNILYIFFFLYVFIFECADVGFQIIRKPPNTPLDTVTKYCLAIFSINLMLWLEFNYSRMKKQEPVGPNGANQR
jgi:hypothetical protein